MFGEDVADPRDLIRVWSEVPSDVGGCIAFGHPQPLRPPYQLKDARTPVMSLLDALHVGGYVAFDGKVVHSALSPSQYDSRKLASQKDYLRCLLALPDLMVAGVVSFESGACQAYYALLLKSPGAALPGQSAANYRRLLGEACGVAPALLALEADAASVAPALMDMDPIVGDNGHVPIPIDDMPLLALLDGHVPAPLTPILGDEGVELDVELEPAFDEPIVGEPVDDAPPVSQPFRCPS